MRKLKCLFVFMIFLCTLTGCSCEHEWQDATCTEAQICLKCEKTEGNPNGHSWVEATCTEPKKCLSCEETEGNPRGHQESDWSYEKTSVKYAEITYVKKCNICGQNSDKKSERIQTFDGNREFEMTAKEFTERFGYKLDSIKENNLITQENSASGDYACAIGDTSTKEVVGGVLFSAKNEESITYNQGSTQKISLITAIVYNSEDGARVLLGTIITLDPSLSIEEGLDVGEAILKAAASGKTYTKNNISYAVIVQGGSTYIMASAK